MIVELISLPANNFNIYKTFVLISPEKLKLVIIAIICSIIFKVLVFSDASTGKIPIFIKL
jgi:hypothetical protein